MITRDRPLLSLRWGPELILALAGGPKRYNTVRTELGLGDGQLRDRVDDFVDRGILERHIDLGPPAKVTFSLTELGQKFVEPLRQLEEVEALVD